MAIRLARDVESAPVGELFSQFCPPNCIDILVEGPTPWQVLRGDVEEIFSSSGYEIVRDVDLADFVLTLDVTHADVRSDDPGWLKLKITTRASVAFSASLESSLGDAWDETFAGEDRIEHSYASLSDSEQILGNAYCEALTSFSNFIEAASLQGDHPSPDETSSSN